MKVLPGFQAVLVEPKSKEVEGKGEDHVVPNLAN